MTEDSRNLDPTVACPRTELLRRYRAGELDPEAHAEVDSHVRSCDGCRSRLSRIEAGPGPDDPGDFGPIPRGALATTLAGTPGGSGATSGAELTSESPALAGRYRVVGRLGEGSFGRVYLAVDEALDRQVAVKVCKMGSVTGADEVQGYLAEARSMARLDHPNIVPIYDFGQTGEGLCFVVSKYVEGGNLAEKLAEDRPGLDESSRLVAAVAEALDHLHGRGLVHRDIKPANILIDLAGRPCVADFGLATDFDRAGRENWVAGSPSYMSPEQARGEGNRVDRRSDVFSLGVVLYELLTGLRPFGGASLRKILREVAVAEPTPPRQVDPSIPAELERIALKALAKRVSDRYATAGEMAEDLRHFGRLEAGGEASTDGPDPAGRLAEVVPRGLRSFGRDDADFFPRLIPGTRDRHGWPEALRFWKRKIESRDPDATFRVGLIFGPSGCGKSSLVKAGLLPRLAEDVRSVYLEALPGDTEGRLLRGLRRACPGLSRDLGLVDAMAALRRGRGLRQGAKLLVVLDQFEQWLLVARDRRDSELVDALRQCDGGRVQAIVMVRDDFWMAATRFLQDLEVRLVEGENAMAVDLFDPRHARLVLEAFGRAYGALAGPGDGSRSAAEEAHFLDQAIAGLTLEGKVVPVRLALFAEMIKGKPWLPGTLRALGGAEGVGEAFLEETFGDSASPAHAQHRSASRDILRSLLPAPDAEIKGRVRTASELRELSGYASRPGDFEAVVELLDHELRLITPIDPESVDGGPAGLEAAEHGYQLTHDYLVPSIRDWLTRRQRQTRRGRAEIRLAERAAVWATRPETPYLPSLFEWAKIRALTRPAGWTDPQRRMMGRAGRFHGLRGCGALAVAALATWGGVEAYGRVHANSLVDQLETAVTADVPQVIDRLSLYRRWADARLARGVEQYPPTSRAGLHDRLALLPTDPEQVGPVLDRMLAAGPADLPLLARSLAPYRDRLVPRLFDELARAGPGDPSLLAAAGALARYAPGDPRWAAQGGPVASALTTLNPVSLGAWLDLLRPARAHLVRPLGKIFLDRDRPSTEHTLATEILADFAADSPDLLEALILDADPKAFARFFPIVERRAPRAAAIFRAELRVEPDPGLSGLDAELSRDALAGRQARAAIGLARLGHADEAWPLLRLRPDPRLRSFLINWLRPMGVDPAVLASALEARSGPARPASIPPDHPPSPSPSKMDEILFDPDTSIRRGLLQGLGWFDAHQIEPGLRQRLKDRLVELYRQDADPGVHAAAGWTLRRWGLGREVGAIDDESRRLGDRPDQLWYVDGLGQSFVKVDGPVRFPMGSPADEPARSSDLPLHDQAIDHRFAIGDREVSVASFGEFLEANPGQKPGASASPVGPDAGETPVQGVSWYDAAAYCNWLSRRDGIAQDQWCYAPNSRGEYAEGMRIVPDAQRRTGYRLPTEAEWEYACRAGTVTSRYHGFSVELLTSYARFQANGVEQIGRSASLLPNDLGLFDMLGNAYEWCQDPSDGVDQAEATGETLVATENRRIRGGCYGFHQIFVRSAFRGWFAPADLVIFNGFRVARTY